MFRTTFTATLAALAHAYIYPSVADRFSVPEWDFMMKKYGYEYEVYNPVTEDEWTLSLFRVVPKNPYTKPNGRSVLVQHGAFMDAASWIKNSKYAQKKYWDDVPAFFKLADDGYDVWMGNNRGTRYSDENPRWPNANKHNFKEYLYPEENFAKYDFSFFEMGKYDVPSMLDKIIDVSGNEMVSYVGYSQGTGQLFYGLASNEEAYKNKIERAIMLAPCIYVIPMGLDTYLEALPVMREHGINVFNDKMAVPNMAKLCSDPNSQTACGFYSRFMGTQKLPIRSFEQFYQIAISDRFQEYMVDFKATNIQSELVKPGLGAISTVPIHLMVAENDEICSLASAERIQKEIGERVQSFTIVPGVGHQYFMDEANSDKFYSQLKDLLEK